MQFHPGASPGAVQIASSGIWESVRPINMFWLVCSVDYLCSGFAWLPVFSVSCPCPSQGPRLAADEPLCELLLPLRLLFFSSFFFLFFFCSDWFVGPQQHVSDSDLGKPCVGRSCIGSWWTLTSPLERLWLHFIVHCPIFVLVTSPRQWRLMSQSRLRGFNHKPRKEQRPKTARCSFSPVHQTP